MTILVLGDSFADPMGRRSPWANVLGEMFDEDVENHGLGGSSLSYSYNKFLKNYEAGKYSRVIFCSTETSRQTYIDMSGPGSFLPFMVNQENSEVMLPVIHKKDKRWQDPETVNSRHRKIWKGQELINLMYTATYDYTKTAIHDSLRYRIKEPLLILEIDNLMKVQMLDYNALGISFNPFLEGKNRPNHLNVTQSKELARYMHKYFTREFDIDSIFKDPEKYFTTAQTREESGIRTPEEAGIKK